jgi:hypothetical protein
MQLVEHVATSIHMKLGFGENGSHCPQFRYRDHVGGHAQTHSETGCSDLGFQLASWEEPAQIILIDMSAQ